MASASVPVSCGAAWMLKGIFSRSAHSTSRSNTTGLTADPRASTGPPPSLCSPARFFSAPGQSVALVVDVTHATDWPGAEKKRAGEHKLGGGPVLARGSAVSPVVFEMLVACADQEKIPYSIQAAPHDTGTDADAIYNALRGIPTGLVSVPNRYMHSPK